jgi:hypothetical protein
MPMSESVKITRNARDIIQKHTGTLFKDAALSFYGINTAKVKELVNVELPIVEVGRVVMDFVFLLEDDTYLHIEFQTSYNASDLIRFAKYDLLLYERDGRKVRTVVIYTADVKTEPSPLDTGSLVFAPTNVMMGEYDGNTILSELERKIQSDEPLTDTDVLNLIFLPLMKHKLPRRELTISTVKLANTIAEKEKRDTVVAAAFAFGYRYLNENDYINLIGVLKMSLLADMLINETLLEVAKKLLKRGISPEAVAEDTGLDVSDVLSIQSESDNRLSPASA